MRLTRALRKWIAVLTLGALGFAQASVSLAACSMERGTISDVLAAKTSTPCDCGTAMTEFGPLFANRCVAHCTSGLQLSGAAAAIAHVAAPAPTLVRPRAQQRVTWRRRAQLPPVASVPKRIQLHSFLV